MLYQDPEIKTEDKEQLVMKEIEGDKSDEIVRFKLACEAGLPSKEQKAKLWKWYVDETATESDKIFEASMSGFWHWQQLDILAEYVDKFFDVFVEVCKKRPTRYSGTFFTYLAPDLASEHILKRYEELLKNLPEEHKARRRNVEAAIEDQKRLLKSHDLCKTYYEIHK